MPDWMSALAVVGMLCLPLARGLCQDFPGASLVHYRLAESYLQEDNLQSAANEFREALNNGGDPAWTQVWSHIQLGRIFDATGQHDRALNEYRHAVQTGDNTNGALDEANNYLQHAEHAIYLPAPPPPPALGGAPISEPIQKTDPEYADQARLAELEGTVVLAALIDQEGFARIWK